MELPYFAEPSNYESFLLLFNFPFHLSPFRLRILIFTLCFSFNITVLKDCALWTIEFAINLRKNLPKLNTSKPKMSAPLLWGCFSLLCCF